MTSRGRHAAMLAAWLTLLVMLAPVGCRRQLSLPAADVDTDATRALATPAAVKPPQAYALVATFDSGLTKLHGIAVDARDNLYVAGEGGVRVLSPTGETLRQWATSEAATAIAVAADGKVYVARRTGVDVFDADGKPRHSWGKEGEDRGQFRIVTGIAVAGVDVFVADAGNRCVHRFAVDGDFIDDLGRADRAAGVVGLICPSPYLDCAIGPDGLVHVTNPGLTRIEIYRFDGTMIRHWGDPGTAPAEFVGCCNPTNLALLPDGRTVTGEKVIPRVKVYDKEGKMLAYVGPEVFSPDAAGLDVAVDSRERLCVADPGDGKVRVFARQP